MKKTLDPGEESVATYPLVVKIIFFTALGLSSLILNFWGDRLIVRMAIGVAWGGYCLFAFGPDLLRLRRGKQSKTDGGGRDDLSSS